MVRQPRSTPGVVREIVINGRRYTFAQRPEQAPGELVVRSGGNDFLVIPYQRVFYDVLLMSRPSRRYPDDPPDLHPLADSDALPDLEAVARYVDGLR